MRDKTKTKRTPEQAQHFERYSLMNATRAEVVLRNEGECKGNCHAYADMFTYDRWQALGYQVRKGEHGAKLPVIITSEKEDKEGNVTTTKRPWTTTVFCRCQVTDKALSSVAGKQNY